MPAMTFVGNGLDRRVVGEHRVVVDLARDGDRSARRPRAAPGAAGSSRSRGAAGTPRRRRRAGRAPAVSTFSACAWSPTVCAVWAPRARFGHRLERLALVRRVALDRLDEVRDQVVAAAELHVHLRPRVLRPVPQPDEAVVHEDEDSPRTTTATTAITIPATITPEAYPAARPDENRPDAGRFDRGLGPPGHAGREARAARRIARGRGAAG